MRDQPVPLSNELHEMFLVPQPSSQPINTALNSGLDHSNTLSKYRDFFIVGSRESPTLSEPMLSLMEAPQVRIPSELFKTWYANLYGLTRLATQYKDEIKREIFNPLGIAFAHLFKNTKPTDWGRALAVITIEVLGSEPFEYETWSREFWTQIAAVDPVDWDGTIPRTLVLLNGIYSGPAQTLLGGPLQFFLLARACLLVPNIVSREIRAKYGPYDLDEYFHVLEAILQKRRIRNYRLVALPAAEPEDWCFRYLASQFSLPTGPRDRIMPATLLTKHKSFYLDWMRQHFRNRHEKPMLALIGLNGSGRKTIVQGIDSALFNGIPVDDQALRFKTLAVGGEISLRSNHTAGVVVLDANTILYPKPDDTSPSRLRAATSVVLVIEASAFEADQMLPEEVLSVEGRNTIRCLDSVLHALELGKHQGDQYSIMIAYSKCDEFGVVLGNDVRILESPADLQAFMQLAEVLEGNGDERVPDRLPDEAWNQFVKTVSGRLGAAEDVKKLRRILLNGTRVLWERVARDFSKGRATINGYLLQVQPLLDRPASQRNWHGAGYLQLLADFLQKET